MHSRLTAERKPVVLLVIAGLIGFAFGAYLLGWDGIRGTSDYWATTHNDSVQSIAGLRFYVKEGWGWPLLDISSYGYPDGTSLVFTDSIPALAVVAKVLSGVLPDGFHYFGYWMVFCFAMQAVSMVAVLVVLGRRSYLAMAAGSVLGLLQGALLARYFHAALMAHFLIILAIALGLSAGRDERAGSRMRRFWLLIGVSFFVHPYLFAMVTVLAAAFVVEAVYRKRMSAGNGVVWFATAGFVSLAALVVSGAGSAADPVYDDFRFFSMNLFSPVVKQIDATGGQYEGVNYLGLGVIGLLVVVLISARPLLWRVVATRWIPVGATVLLAIYALSPSVYAGHTRIVEFPVVAPLEWLALRFRATGRFGWPLVYLLVIGAILLVLRRHSSRIVVPLLVGTLLVQGLDMSSTAAATHDALHATHEQYLRTEVWAGLVAEHSLVRATPHVCVQGTVPEALASRELQRIAARLGVPITTAAVARRGERCDDPALEQALVPGELRVVWTRGYRVGEPDVSCSDFDLGTVCTLAGLVEGTLLTP